MKKIYFFMALVLILSWSCKKNPNNPVDGTNYGIVEKYNGIWVGTKETGELSGRKIVIKDGAFTYKEAQVNNYEEILVNEIVREADNKYKVDHINGRFLQELYITIEFKDDKTATIAGKYNNLEKTY